MYAHAEPPLLVVALRGDLAPVETVSLGRYGDLLQESYPLHKIKSMILDRIKSMTVD